MAARPICSGRVLAGHDHDLALALAHRIADQPVGGVLEGVAQHKDIATGDVGVVGERQHVDVARGDGDADGVGGTGIDRAEDDLGALVDGLCREGGRALGRCRRSCRHAGRSWRPADRRLPAARRFPAMSPESHPRPGQSLLGTSSATGTGLAVSMRGPVLPPGHRDRVTGGQPQRRGDKNNARRSLRALRERGVMSGLRSVVHLRSGADYAQHRSE